MSSKKRAAGEVVQQPRSVVLMQQGEMRCTKIYPRGNLIIKQIDILFVRFRSN